MKKAIKSAVVRLSGDTVMVRSLDRELLPAMRRVAASLPAGARVLDVGSKNAVYRDIFRGAEFVTLDIVPDHKPDIVADIHELDQAVDPGTFDAIICTEVLEHVRDPERAVAQMKRALKPGGSLLASTPFICPYHPDPTDFWRFTGEAIRGLTKDFDRVEVVGHGSKLLALWYLISGALVPLRLFDRIVYAIGGRRGDRYMPLGFVWQAVR